MARLRIGVIGLGRRWPRYRRALLALKGDARVVALCDPAVARAQHEAQQLGCEAAGSVVELVERDDIDAFVLLGGAWFGLWPLEHASRVNKPVLCAGSLLHEDAFADGMHARLDPAAPIHLALWPAFELLSEAAAQRLGVALGAPRLALAGHVATTESDPLNSGPALALLHGLAGLFEAAPRSVSVLAPLEQPRFATIVLAFDDGRMAQLSLWGGPAEVGRTWLDVDAEAGTLRAELPRQLDWRDAEGRHTLSLPGGLAEVWLVDRFLTAVRQGEPPMIPFTRAFRSLTWLRAARRSRQDGTTIELVSAGP